MTMGYVIKWQSTSTDIQGVSAKPLSLSVAQAAAEEMNAMYPEVHHWVEIYQSDVDDDEKHMKEINSEAMEASDG